MGTNIIAGVPILPAFIARQRQRFIGRFEKAGAGRGWRQAINLFLLDIFHLIFGLLELQPHSLPCPSLPSLEGNELLGAQVLIV
jgi:hypothetical protein